MKATSFFVDFVNYYNKARILQKKNICLLPKDLKVNDPLMDSVSIYDTINRKYAGFSKALEDIHGVRTLIELSRYNNYTNRIDLNTFQFLHLFHRFTGSGASFQPRLLPDGSINPKEHGYCNNKVEHLAAVACLNPNNPIEKIREYIVQCKEPMVTSTGNQPPSLKNGDPSKYRLAQQYYFDNFAESFIKDFLNYAEAHKPLTIKQGVDYSCAWHKSRGFKQWHFVLTAFVMDTAEYYPTLVDPSSHCYYGSNCIKSFDLMFTKEKTDKERGNDYYEKCMTETCEVVNGLPYDVEDVCCDYIRYVKEYVPKGYEHLDEYQRQNNSTLKGLDGQYPEHIRSRIIEVLG